MLNMLWTIEPSGQDWVCFNMSSSHRPFHFLLCGERPSLPFLYHDRHALRTGC